MQEKGGDGEQRQQSLRVCAGVHRGRRRGKIEAAVSDMRSSLLLLFCH
jgi:hypothetical protein